MGNYNEGTAPAPIHVILYTSDEASAGDGFTVGPFASEPEAQAFLKRFRETRRTGAHGEVFVRFITPAECFELFGPDEEECGTCGEFVSIDGGNVRAEFGQIIEFTCAACRAKPKEERHG